MNEKKARHLFNCPFGVDFKMENQNGNIFVILSRKRKGTLCKLIKNYDVYLMFGEEAFIFMVVSESVYRFIGLCGQNADIVWPI